MKLATRGLLALGTILFAAQCCLLVSRARDGRSDVGVLLRSATLLNEGAGPELYQARDVVTGWSRAHPPAVLSLFQPLIALGPTSAGVVWAVANVAFLLLALRALRRFIGTLGPESEGHRRAFPFLATLLMVLAAGSVQVGQLSLLFLTCWLLALDSGSRNRYAFSGMALALPAAMKVYPALMLAVWAALPWRLQRRMAGWFVGGLLGFTVLLPSLTVGGRTLSLIGSWARHSLLGTGGRVSSYLSGPGAVSTQSLESLLTRFLTGGTAFHSRYPWVPHLNLSESLVLGLVAILTLVLLSASAWATIRLRRAPISVSSRLLLATALWSATLYAVLPETKARYAVYAFPAFLPLVEQIARAAVEGDRKGLIRKAALGGASLLALIQALPGFITVLGLGYVGNLALWGWNLRYLLGQCPQRQGAVSRTDILIPMPEGLSVPVRHLSHPFPVTGSWDGGANRHPLWRGGGPIKPGRRLGGVAFTVEREGTGP